MEALHFRNLETHLHLRPSQAAEARRLTSVLQDVLDESLETALERTGIPLNEEICIRQIYIPVSLRLSASDAQLTAQWSLALASHIAEIVGRGGADVIRYQSRLHALTDFALGIARMELGRTWAWRQMGLVETSAVGSWSRMSDQLVAALEREPTAIVPVLIAVARQGVLAHLLTRLPEPAWPRLATAALSAAGLAAVRWGDLERAPAELVPGAVSFERARRVRCLESSELIRAVRRGSSEVEVLGSISIRRVLAVFALLDADRGLLLRSTDRVPECVAEFVAELEACVRPPPSADSPPPAFPAAVPLDTPLPEIERQSGFSHAGGLLFLLGIVDETGIEREIVESELGARRTQAWALHQLALALAEVDESDAAALAFAGLGPQTDPPSIGEKPPTAAEMKQLLIWRSRVEDELETRVPGRKHVLAWVCQRKAKIVADPGWIEVHLSLDEVSTEIRRAGLDLDPGNLPWLGVVIKFVYRDRL